MSWECYRLRAALVDFADGSLDERSSDRVERHLSTCADCSAAVLELREVPTEVRRRLASEPDKAFWSAQRASILDAVAGLSPAESAPRKRSANVVRWTAFGSLAAAAAAALVFVRVGAVPATRVAPVASEREVPQALRATQVVQVATNRDDSSTALVAAASSDPWAADEGSLLSLADELESQVSESSEDGLI